MRSIKPEFFADQDLAEDLPNRDARLLYIGLWGLADEHGRLRGDARAIKGQLFAFDDDLTAEAIDALIDMIAGSGRAVRYRVGRAVYLFLPKLADHQRLEPDKVPSRLPSPDDDQAEHIMIRSSENFPDESAWGANSSVPKHVACSREQVAGSKEQTLPLAALAEPESKAIPKRVVDEAFARFWSAYPRKVSKGDAAKVFARLAKAPDADLEAIVAGAERYRDDGARKRSEIKFTKHPDRWLNAQCWLDEPTPDNVLPLSGHRPYRNPEDTSIYEGAL